MAATRWRCTFASVRVGGDNTRGSVNDRLAREKCAKDLRIHICSARTHTVSHRIASLSEEGSESVREGGSQSARPDLCRVCR
jgi:hypothetical protein